MKRALLIVATLSLLAACGNDDNGDAGPNPDGVENPTVFVANDDGGTFNNAKFIRVTIDGMPCIIYKDKVGDGHGKYAYSGLTCDWDAPTNEAPR